MVALAASSLYHRRMTEFQNVRATPFSVRKSPAQADQLGTLVRDNAEWLQDSVYSGAVARFNWRPAADGAEAAASARRGRLSALLPPKINAMRHIARMALFHPTLHSYILEAQPAGQSPETETPDDWKTVGIGTVTRTVNAVLDGHPNFPSYNLTDVDYWLDATAESTALHGMAARSMVNQARRQVHQHENQDQVRLIASIVPKIGEDRDIGFSAHQPVGFSEFMHPAVHGEAVPISMIGEDPYGIAKGPGRRLHVLTLTAPTAGELEL